MNIGWVKLHRQFKDWEWYNKSEMVHLFIHCLIKANFKDGSFQGIECKKGSFITSLKHLSDETNISIQTIRTCLKKLQLTKEIEVKSTNKLTQITICNYDSYQQENEDTNKQLTNNQQTTNKQLTTIEEYKESKEENNNIKDRKTSFAISLEPYLELYNREMLNNFYMYWTEHGEKDKKMRFEKEKSFDVKLRLLNWSKRSESFKQKEFKKEVLFVTPEGIEITDKLVLHVYQQTGKV